MERETRIELATNSLEGCDSTIELLPLRSIFNHLQRHRVAQLVPAKHCYLSINLPQRVHRFRRFGETFVSATVKGRSVGNVSSGSPVWSTASHTALRYAF